MSTTTSTTTATTMTTTASSSVFTSVSSSASTSMTASTLSSLSHRDRAVLRAVAAGRCQISAGAGAPLSIDGICCCDQLVGPRLIRAGLITAVARPGPARLTETGRALLEAA